MPTASAHVARLGGQPPASSTGTSTSCVECMAQLAHDQRYCVECGARRGPLAPAIAGRIGTRSTPDVQAVERLDRLASPALDPDRAPAPGDGPARAGGLRFPSPAAAGMAISMLLGFGVLVGSAVSSAAGSAMTEPLLVAMEPAAIPPATSGTAASASRAPEPPPVQGESTASGAGAATAASEATTSTTSTTTSPGAGGTGTTPPGSSGLPPIRHVFMIVLSEQGLPATFGATSKAPYLARTLRDQGELVEGYYAVAGGELANEIALISGQGPTPQTESGCPVYAPLTPGTMGAEGQALGQGCLYPAQVPTLADQLTKAGKSWRAYVEGIEDGGPGQPTSCRHPLPGAADPNQAATPTDPYVTWRNPFVYFDSITAGAGCQQDDLGLERLAFDLRSAATTPSFAYIVPDRCHDGSEAPCSPGAPAGLPGADTFLKAVVPEIESSPAYKEGGLIMITSDQAPQSGPDADSRGCCTSVAYPNLPSTSSSSTTTSATAADGPGTTTTTTTTDGAGGQATGATAGGGQVGLLMISKYVKPGSVDATGQYNHFALLRSIENLFGLSPLGYAGAKGLLAFDASVFNAYR